MTKVRRLFFLGLIVLAAVGVTLLAERYGSLTGIAPAEQALLGYRQIAAAQTRAGAPEDEQSEVVLVLFDSLSVSEWSYLSPFPRPFLAELIDGMAAAGVKAIGLDVFLDRTYAGL